MNVVILEDELLAARHLQNVLARVAPDARIAAVLSSVARARSWLETNPPPELIFSDIQLSDGLSFSVFEGIRLSCPVIFTTAYDEYAIRAFKVNSIDYLLKPVDATELSEAMAKFKRLQPSGDIGALPQWGDKTNRYKTRFLVERRNTLVPVLADEIACFFRDELIFLYTMSNEKLITDHHSLEEVESLVDPASFFRVNRQYIIHVQAAASVKVTHKGLALTLKTKPETEIEISREKAAAFKKWLGRS